MAEQPLYGISVVEADLRPFMARFPSGVAVVTSTAEDGKPIGMTCTSLCSVSLSPPVLLVSLRAASPTLTAMLRTGIFSLNLLDRDAQPTAALFASGLADRFSQVFWRQPLDTCGPHLFRDACTVADCQVVDRKVVGDHVVVFGQVARVTALTDLPPLLYGLRQYAAWPVD
jgi:flavin reductase (DIM6/NTAB) family NADH-FMN oxidoreductase RutF